MLSARHGSVLTNKRYVRGNCDESTEKQSDIELELKRMSREYSAAFL